MPRLPVNEIVLTPAGFPFSKYFTLDIIKWFETNGVKLKTEADGRMFPVTDDSQTIIECLLQKAHELNIIIKTNYGIAKVEKKENVFGLKFMRSQKVISKAKAGHCKT